MSRAAPAGATLSPRSAHLTSAITHRDLYGTVRGTCRGCTICGRYMIVTARNYTAAHGSGIHPDNDPSITHCSRCGCPPDAHEAVPWETERELGTDAFALQQWDAAVLHYSRAIDGNPAEAALWSNRAAAYLAKGWHAQALKDAERALTLKPEWFRPWARKGAALLGLGRPAEAETAYGRALEVVRGEGEDVPPGTIEALETGVGEARMARRKQERVKTAAAAATAARAAAPAANDSTTRADKAPTSGLSHPGLVSRASMGSPPPAAAATPPPPPAARTPEELLAAVEAKYAAVATEIQDLRILVERLRLIVEAGRPATAPPPPEAAEAVQHVEAAKKHLAAVSDPLTIQNPASESRGTTEDGEVASCGSSSVSDSPAAPAPPGAASEGAQSHSSDPFGSPVIPSSAGSVSEEQREDDPSNADSSAAASDASSTDGDADDLEWMARVEAARRELGLGEGSQGFVPPPPAAATSPRRRASQPTDAQDSSTQSKLNLRSLQGILEAAAARRRRLDPDGVERGTCRGCGQGRCSTYLAGTIGNVHEHRISIVPGSVSAAEALRRCAACGCDCGQHETADETARRRASEEHRRRALAAEREAAASQREHRVAAAVARRAAAEAAGEPLQSTDCDMLTHSRRKNCTECADCTGFRIFFGPTDGNIPEIMFFCSLCGCAAASHAVDAEWEREEAARRDAEAAAVAARARAAAAAAAAPAARRAEAEAYAALGLHYGADAKAVTRAYKRLALRLHPDKAGGVGSTSEFVRVTHAYKLLAGQNS